MQLLLKAAAVAVFATMLAACQAITPVPGSERVKVTENPADVASCKAVGNIDATRYGALGESMMRNEVIGDGGDTFLQTVWAYYVGVAYKCAKD
jgi:hypothetical protein